MLNKLTVAIIVGVAVSAFVGVALVMISDDGGDSARTPNNDDNRNIGDGYRIILPSKESQKGYIITSNSYTVPDGGNCILSLEIFSGYIEEGLLVTINDNPVSTDSMYRIRIDNIRSDQIVKVKGIYDVRMHLINVPKEQIGYTLTASSDSVHRGESYDVEYTLKEGYEEIPGEFKISVEGIREIDLTSGVATVTDVLDNHNIIVEGVKAINYIIMPGANTVLKVNGVVSNTATINDVITIRTIDDRTVPQNYNSNLPVTVKVVSGGYMVKDNTAFPSLSLISVGKNVVANGIGDDRSFFVCQTDVINITPKSGYSIPDSYRTMILNQNGAAQSGTGYTFKNNVSLPSIYKVSYYGYKGILHKSLYETEGLNRPLPSTNPVREGANFSGWSSADNIVKKDVEIVAQWELIIFDVKFGENITYFINGNYRASPGSFKLTIEDKIIINCSPGYSFPDFYFHPSTVIFSNEDNAYHVRNNAHFKTIHYVRYNDTTSDKVYIYYHTESSLHTLVNPAVQVTPDFNFNFANIGKTPEMFAGWSDGSRVYVLGDIVVDHDYFLVPIWR